MQPAVSRDPPSKPHDLRTHGVAAMRRPRRLRVVPLLGVEPRLAGGLDGAALAAARERVLVPYVDVAGGAWAPDPAETRPLAVLVLEGKLLATAPAGAGESLTLVGPGDLLDVRMIDEGERWHALEPARLALLDGRFLLAAHAWPQLVSGLLDAFFASAHEQRRLAAALKLPRIEDRLLAYMAVVISRWGVVRPDGFVVSLPLTHHTLGRLVAARRPTVTLALSALAREGGLRRLPGGIWRMPGELVDGLTSNGRSGERLELVPDAAEAV